MASQNLTETLATLLGTVQPSLRSQQLEASLDKIVSMGMLEINTLNMGSPVGGGGTLAHIRIDTTTGGGTSRKIGNIVVTWPKLLPMILESAAPVKLVASSTLVDPFSICSLLLALHRLANTAFTAELKPHHAATMVALWKTFGNKKRVPQDIALEHVQSHLQDSNLRQIDAGEFHAILNDLTRLRCVDLVDGDIILLESVELR